MVEIPEHQTGKKQIDIEAIKAECTGRWAGILASIGIDVGDGSHKPCPMCGGKDRFRFDDKESQGTWICNQCGAGDGWSLIQKILNCDFIEAVKAVKPLMLAAPIVATVEKKITPDRLRKIFVESSKITEHDPVGMYLQHRGLSLFPTTLRYHPALRDPDTGKKYPCMLGLVQMPDGTAATMHRTFLDGKGHKAPIDKPKKLLPGLQKLTGGAIRLFAPKDGMIGIAEGIETAIACTMCGVPTWAAISSTLVESFDPPNEIKTVIVYGDNDQNYTGQAAAYRLANRLVIKGFKVDVDIPECTGDFLDLLTKHTEQSEAPPEVLELAAGVG